MKSKKSLRIKMVWHVLRGRPAIYRMHFDGGIELPKLSDCFIAECLFTGKDARTGITKMEGLLRGLADVDAWLRGTG